MYSWLVGAASAGGSAVGCSGSPLVLLESGHLRCVLIWSV